MKISVVIPCYNNALTIERCILSVFDQVEPVDELIVVDDFSSDNSFYLISLLSIRYRSCLIKIFQNTTNLGPSAARNFGIAQSTGDFICFLDADDYWHRQKIFFIKNILLKYPEVDLLGHQSSVNGNQNLSYSNECFHLRRITSLSLLVRNFATTPSISMRRALGLNFDVNMRYCEDHDLWLRISQSANVSFLYGPSLTILGRLPGSSGGLSGDKMPMRHGEIEMYKKFFRAKNFFGLFYLIVIFSITKHLIKKLMNVISNINSLIK